jgi:hypothetical protein
MNHVLLQNLMYLQFTEIKFGSPKNTSGKQSAAATRISNYVHTRVYIRTAVRRLARIFYFRNHIKIPAEQARPAGHWLFINAVQWLEPFVSHLK